VGGLYDLSILGSGDHNMALSLIGAAGKSVNGAGAAGYRESIEAFQSRALGLKLGYVPGIVRHYFHGSKKNRKYSDRWQILVRHQYDPNLHIKMGTDGLLAPTADCPQEMLEEISQYFAERNEDEYFAGSATKD